MDRKAKKKTIALLVCGGVLLVWAGFTLAEVMSGGIYTIDKDVVAGGGSSVSGGSFDVLETIGQPGGISTITGGDYELESGFLHRNLKPATPSCTAPISNAEASSDTPTLQWSSFSDPDEDTQGGWQIQIDTEDDWDGAYVQTPSGETAVSEFALTTPLEAADIYYWRVRVKDAHGEWSGWSSSAGFRQLHIYVNDDAAAGGNGTSASKYQTITAAINKVSVNFTYTIHVDAGTYNEQVDLNGKNAKLYGAGQGSSIVDGQSTRSYGIYIHNSSTTSSSIVDGFTFQNATTDGARITSGTGIQFSNCTFTANGYRGVYVLTSTTTASFADCTISNNGTVGNEAGLRIDDGPAVTVDNCDIYGNYYGARLYYGNWTIKNSYIHDNNYCGVLQYYRGTNRPGVLRDNIICKNRYYGILLYYNSNALVWNNAIGGNGDNGSSHSAIYMYQSVEAQIVGNKFVGQYGYALGIWGKDHPLIANNTIYANNSIGIYWDYESKPASYNNCIVSNNSWGVYKGAYVLNDDEDIQYNNVWNNSSGAYYNCAYSNDISGDPLFYVNDSGASTSLTASALTDTSKSWTTNQWKGYILIPNTGNRRRAYIIVSNTSDTLTVGSWDAAYEVTDYASAGNSYEITDLTLQAGSPNIDAGHAANRFSDTYGAYDRNDIGSSGGYGPVPRAVPYNISACVNNTGVQLDSTYYQCHPDKTATFSWAQTGGDSVTLSSTTSKTPTFTAPATAQTLTFTMTVNDGYADGAADASYAYINPRVTVNGSGSYTSINNAVDNASSGQTVNVPAGRFVEQVDTDGKAITLDGADSFASIIDGDDRINYCVYIHTNELSSTVVQDLQLINSYRYAIYVYDSVAADNTSPTIQNNYVHDNYVGLYTYRSHPIVTSNYFVRNSAGSYAILIGNDSAGAYKKNHISGNRSYGIYAYPQNVSYVPNFENNIIAGNTSYGVYARYANTNLTFVNDAICNNQSIGIRSLASSVTAKNNIVAGNYSYGLYADGGGTLTGTYNDVWNNSSGSYYGCSAGTGDISSDPLFVIEDSGASTGITKTTLTDTSKSWAANQWRGFYLISDTNDKYIAMIWSNTSDTLTVMNMRNIDWSADAGNSYRIISFKLQNASPCIDAGTNTGAPTEDMWGDTRPYVNSYGYYDDVVDIGVDETAYSLPGKPTIGAPQALSSTSIRWNFTDTAADELGFRVHNASHAAVASEATPNISYIDETGLSPNTQYTRHVVSYNATVIANSPNAAGESDDSGTAALYTLSANADAAEANGRSTSTWYQSGSFVFSSSALGSGQIQYYRYVWDRSPATAVTGGDTQWPSGNLELSGYNSKSNYLHILSYNGDNVAASQGTQHYGPYYFVDTSRLLYQGKFVDDDGNLIELGPKE